MRPVPASPTTLRTRATRHGLAAVLLVLLVGASLGRPAAVSAISGATLAGMDAQILTSINTDRAARGLRALRLDARLMAWSTDRSVWMAARADLTHLSWQGSPCNLYAVMGISWYQCGEAIADTTVAPSAAAATALYALWKGSPDHLALITSTTFNYVGIGVAYRAANRTTYASVLFLEGPEHNRPIPSFTATSVDGRTVHWAWTAYDPLLQSHTAQVVDYDVELRLNNGAWSLLRTASVDVSCTLRNRVPGSTWTLRFRARDNVGNLSAWLTSATVVVH